MKALAILIDPDGNEFFIAYGPKTTDRAKASRFASETIATRAATNVIYGNPDAFWNSERAHAENTRKQHRGWTYRVELEESE